MEKSKIQLAIEKASNLLKFFTEKQVEKFESVKVKDADTLVEYSELVKGADVSTSSSTGSVPAPDGDYSLVNGAKFTVKDGKVVFLGAPNQIPLDPGFRAVLEEISVQRRYMDENERLYQNVL